jgi:hypothetical protein
MRTSVLGLLSCLSSLAAQGLAAQEPDIVLLAAPATEGIVLRWTWPEGERPTGYHVDRRAPGEDAWARLTTRPVTRLRDRAAARQRLGESWLRYQALLFPGDPLDELRDPESHRSLLLLVADLEPVVAEVLGLRFEDAGAERGKAYEYRLSTTLAGGGEREAARAGPVTAGGWEPPAGPDSLRAAQTARGVTLQWSGVGAFSAYHVDRRRQGGPWERVSDVPVIGFSHEAGAGTAAAPWNFRDSTARAGDTLTYAVTGIDPFGRGSRRSDPATIAVRDVQPPEAPRQVTTAVRGDTVVVSWVPPAGGDAAAYQVWRAADRDGPFAPAGPPVPPTRTTVRDVSPSGSEVTWYHVTAIDRAGNVSAPSFTALAVVRDLAPPPAPDSLRAVADTGRIALRWRPVAVRDVRGYRVYRASVPHGTFALQNPRPLDTPAYHDAVPRGADHAFYYRVTAVDSAFNESAPSAVLAATPPDTRPPSAPRIEWVRPCEDCLVVRWAANPEPDVRAYRLLVRPLGDTAWRTVRDSLPAPATGDTVPGLEARRLYQVSVMARDDAGNWSAPARPVTGEPTHRQPPPRLTVRRAQYDEVTRGIVVEWGPPAGAAERVRVERRDRETGVVVIVADVPAAESRVVDRRAEPGREYEYAVRPVDRFGNAAPPAGWRRIRIPEVPR